MLSASGKFLCEILRVTTSPHPRDLAWILGAQEIGWGNWRRKWVSGGGRGIGDGVRLFHFLILK
ncbi:MAG: hypothetical protein A7315_12475 [Candidatus Altiarchaeales archaeon WOR_SM1_79]|nr:MAG: hypothetical protein A7315_12475 [Candidatus Altiarchaeales archaeon WOR_SM1_79]